MHVMLTPYTTLFQATTQDIQEMRFECDSCAAHEPRAAQIAHGSGMKTGLCGGSDLPDGVDGSFNTMRSVRGARKLCMGHGSDFVGA